MGRRLTIDGKIPFGEALVALHAERSHYSAANDQHPTLNTNDMSVLRHMIGFLVTTDVAKAKSFFGDTLGFTKLTEDPYGMTFDANGTKLRVVKAEKFVAAQGTVLGWEVQDMPAAIHELNAQGVRFEHYNLPYMKQDALGIWLTPNGDEVAWFKDPEGNVLSISKHPH